MTVYKPLLTAAKRAELLSGTYSGLKEVKICRDEFRSVTLKDVVFTDCHFSQVTFDGVTLDGCKFVRCTFEEVRFEKCLSTTEVVLKESKLKMCRFAGGNFFQISINQCEIQNTVISWINAVQINCTGGSVMDVMLANLRLSSLMLSAVSVKNLTINCCGITHVSMDRVEGVELSLLDSAFEHFQLESSDLGSCSWLSCQIRRLEIRKSILDSHVFKLGDYVMEFTESEIRKLLSINGTTLELGTLGITIAPGCTLQLEGVVYRGEGRFPVTVA